MLTNLILKHNWIICRSHFHVTNLVHNCIITQDSKTLKNNKTTDLSSVVIQLLKLKWNIFQSNKMLLYVITPV